MIENYLRSDHIFLFTLFHVAIVPSVCEEILFRGYVPKNFEKSMLPVLAIILSGLFIWPVSHSSDPADSTFRAGYAARMDDHSYRQYLAGGLGAFCQQRERGNLGNLLPRSGF